MFSGPGKSRTRGVLSASTSATLGHRFPAWFISGLLLFISPLFLLGVAAARGLVPQFPVCDPQSVGLGIGLVFVYWGLTLLMLGTCFVDVEHKCLIGLQDKPLLLSGLFSTGSLQPTDVGGSIVPTFL